MPQSFAQLYAHLIFSTKNRRPMLDDEIRPRVHGYLATVMRNLDSPFVVVGGVADHVHILFDMGKSARRIARTCSSMCGNKKSTIARNRSRRSFGSSSSVMG